MKDDDRPKALGLTCGIGSMLLGARRAGFRVTGNIEWRTYYHQKDELGRSTFTGNFPGAVMKKKRGELTPEEMGLLDYPDLAMGHPESHPDLPIYTSKGWRMTSELVVGDLVLTHKGRFRRVLAVYRRKPGPDTEKITLSRNSRKGGRVVVLAGNHPVLMEDGTWRKARELTEGNRIVWLTEESPVYTFKAYTISDLCQGKFDDEESLFDLSVDEDNSYVANDLVVHNCGNFSNLKSNKQQGADDPGDIPLFVELVAETKPRFFVMDDLPRAFVAFPMEEYAKRLPEYDLFPEWVSNWGYGNVQKHRNRMFMIGARKDERWAFRPGEEAHGRTVEDEIGDLPLWPDGRGNVPNHDPHNLDAMSNCPRSPIGGPGPKYLTWAELAEWFGERPPGTIYSYVKADGTQTQKFGLARTYWDKHSHVLHGGRPIIHPIRCFPLTIRERARIQGFDDDFVFYGTKLDGDGRWDHERNQHMIKQTGKAMPIQFCEYVAKQIMAAVKRESWSCSDRRVIRPNEHVDAAKMWYCDNVGYADQDRACSSCWMRDVCPIRRRIFSLPDEPVIAKSSIIRAERSPREPRVVVKSERKPARVYETNFETVLTNAGDDA